VIKRPDNVPKGIWKMGEAVKHLRDGDGMTGYDFSWSGMINLHHRDLKFVIIAFIKSDKSQFKH
jgi:hypothetical protein